VQKEVFVILKAMKLHTVRLRSGDELRSALQTFAKEHKISAGFIITCVGALQDLTVRLAGATSGNQPTKSFNESFEIVSLTGTITSEDCHLHISASDVNGDVHGGHLRSAKIDITAEVVIGEDETAVYARVLDKETGFEELVVREK
jgi:predicted DNA-binding protein with PD1-like motif